MILNSGEIILMPVWDAYNLNVSPPVIYINYTKNGELPNLTEAYSTLYLTVGSKKVSFSIDRFYCSDTSVTVAVLDGEDGYSKRVAITSISDSTTSGLIELYVTSGAYQTIYKLGYSINKSAVLYDWLEDWNGTKTEIGGEYIVTPKIFAGTKDSQDKLNGVLLGKFDTGVGLWGYQDNKEVFSLTDSGSHIAGWSITPEAIMSEDGRFRLYSSGRILNVGDTEEDVIWEVNNKGEAFFSRGNVLFRKNGSGYVAGGNVAWDTEGNASFQGEITAKSGNIGGWNISDKGIYVKYFVDKGYCLFENDIVISPSGLRGTNWKIEPDGSFSFANGNLSCDKDGNLEFAGRIKQLVGAPYVLSIDFSPDYFLAPGETGVATVKVTQGFDDVTEIGRASCRERVYALV